MKQQNLKQFKSSTLQSFYSTAHIQHASEKLQRCNPFEMFMSEKQIIEYPTQ